LVQNRKVLTEGGAGVIRLKMVNTGLTHTLIEPGDRRLCHGFRFTRGVLLKGSAVPGTVIKIRHRR